MRFAVWLLLAAALLPLSASARGFPGASFGNGFASPSACTISAGSPTLSNNTFPSGAASGTVVGSVGVSTSGNCAGLTDTLTITGTDAASFALSATAPPANLTTVGVLSAGPYHINLVSTWTGGTVSGSPATTAQTITATAAGQVALTRTFNNPTAVNTNTLTNAFWTMGYPFKAGEIPTGKIVSGCTLGGSSVPCSLIARKLAANGDVEWGQLLVDFTGISLPAAGTASLVLSTATGSWSSTTSCANSRWEALSDAVTLSNLTVPAGAPTGTDITGSGTWVATFDGGATNTIETYGSSPQGLYVQVIAAFTSAGITHRNLRAVMDYWVTEDGAGNCAVTPIESWGPFIENVILHPGAVNSTISAFLYDAAFDRGATKVRDCSTALAYCGLTTPAFAEGNANRPDAQGDWTASDPGIYVTQDYTAVVATKRAPPFAAGVVYAGGLIQLNTGITSVSGAVFTFSASSSKGIFDASGGNYYPSAVEFTTIGSLTGVSLNTVYWAVRESNTTLSLYDTLAHALSNGATGLITPAGSIGSGVTLEIDSAPGTTGQFALDMQVPGGRPDISLTSEWGAAYLVGNTQAWQRLGRVMSYDQASIPVFGADATATTQQQLISFVDSANTPAGMTSRTNDNYGGGGTPSSDINGGATPKGGQGGYIYDNAHNPSPAYLVWLLEGGPFLRDVLIGFGEGSLAASYSINRRNLQIPGGALYNGAFSCTQLGTAMRAAGWVTRNVVSAAMAATQGSAEEAYFRNLLTVSTAECAAWTTYLPAAYQTTGFIYMNQTVGGSPNTIGNTVVEGFMESFAAIGLAWGDLLQGDYVAGLGTQSTYISGWLDHFYGAGGCPYFSTAYEFGPGLSDPGAAIPGNYVSTWGEVGIDSGVGAIMNLSSSSPTVTLIPATKMPWTLTPGDGIRFTLDNTNGNGTVPAPPAPFVTQTDYYIGNPNQAAKTFELYDTSAHAIAGGSTGLLQAAATMNGASGWTIPLQVGCPATGTISGSGSDPGGYVMQSLTPTAMLVELGILPVADYNNVKALFTGSCTTEMDFCMAPP